MLYDLGSDPHQQHNLAGERRDIVDGAQALLTDWLAEMLVSAARGRDPHDNVMAEGGPYHVRGQLPKYLERLRATERGQLADRLEMKWGESA
jgi:choline-sulfatase